MHPKMPIECRLRWPMQPDACWMHARCDFLPGRRCMAEQGFGGEGGVGERVALEATARVLRGRGERLHPAVMVVAPSSTVSNPYDLPTAEDTSGWRGLMRPCTGHLELVKPRHVAACWRRGHQVEAVTVWLHCGLHFVSRTAGGSGSTAPTPGDLPSAVDGNRHFNFRPLRRDEVGAPRPAVRVYAAQESEDVRHKGGRWVVELPASGAEPPLRFCASSRSHADAWAHELRLRAAPMVEVWARLSGAVSGAGGAAAAAGASAARRSRLSRFLAGAEDVRLRLANDVLAGVVGVATAVRHDTLYNVGVAAGPLVGVGLDTLLFVGRVFVNVRQAPEMANTLSDRVSGLCNTLAHLILPAVHHIDDASELLLSLGSLVADLEVLAGELHHLVRSRRRRIEHGLFSATTCGRTTLLDSLEACERHAGGLIPLVHVVQGATAGAGVKRLENALLAVPVCVASVPLPELPPNVYVDWNDSTSPPALLYKACMRNGASTSSAVSAEGMGGVGKTTACLAVAHKVADDEDGRKRFPDGVHWLQLSQTTDAADVKTWVCALVSALTRECIAVVDLRAAESSLRTALASMACLLVIDDVWDHDWVSVFTRALADSTASSMLFSTRNAAIGNDESVSISVPLRAEGGPTAEGVLLAHAEAGGVTHLDKNEVRVKRGVSLCGGLALALAVLGALVRKLGWGVALRRVEHDKQQLLSTRTRECPLGYQSLWPCLQASQNGLGTNEDSRSLWRLRFLALCVISTKQLVPLSALEVLWGEPAAATERIATKLCDAALVTLVDQVGTMHLGLHDLLVEYLAHVETMGHPQRTSVHADLVDAYCRRSGLIDKQQVAFGDRNVAVRQLWKLPSDGFVEVSLPRLLVEGGCRTELEVLLCDMFFISWRVMVAGGDCGVYRKDCLTAKLPALDRVATIVEGTWSSSMFWHHAHHQLVAWRIRELFGGGPASETHGLAPHQAAHLSHTAGELLPSPTIHLFGDTQLSPPQERHLWKVEGRRSLACAVASDRAVYVIVSEKSGLLKVFDAESGVEEGCLRGHTSHVTCLATVPGGSSGSGMLVSGSADCTVRVWDVVNKKQVAALEGHTAGVECMVVVGGGSSSGNGGARVVSGSWDGTVRVWDVDNQSVVRVLTGHAAGVECLTVVDSGSSGGGGTLVVSGGWNDTVRSWSIDNGTSERAWRVGGEAVFCLATVSDSARVVSGGMGGRVRVWDMGRPSAVAELDCGDVTVDRLAVVGGGGGPGVECLVIAMSDCTLGLWDMVSGSPMRVLQGRTGRKTFLVPVDGGGGDCGPRLVTSGRRGTVQVWDVDRGMAVEVLKGHVGTVKCLAAVPSGGIGGAARVVSCSTDQTARLWELNDAAASPDPDAATASIPLDGNDQTVTCLTTVCSIGGVGSIQVVSGGKDATLRVWDAASGHLVAVLKAGSHAVCCLAAMGGVVGGRGASVVSGDDKGSVRVWDLSSMAEVAHFQAHSDRVACVAMVASDRNAHGKRVLWEGEKHHVLVWDVEGQEQVAVLKGHTDRVTCLATVSGGSVGGRALVASASYDRTVRVWDVTVGSTIAVLSSGNNSIMSGLAMTSDGIGARLFGTSKLAVHAWDTTTWTPIRTLEHLAEWQDLAVAPSSGADEASPADATCSGSEALVGLRRGAVVLRSTGQCAVFDLVDGQEWLLPGPDATSICMSAMDVIAIGTAGGDVFFGRIR